MLPLYFLDLFFLDLMNKGSQATSIIVAQYMLKAIF